MKTYITADTRPVLLALNEAEALLADSPQLSFEVRDRLLSFLDSGLEIGRVESLPALGASEVFISLELPDKFLEFMSAIRTRNFNRGVEVGIDHMAV